MRHSVDILTLTASRCSRVSRKPLPTPTPSVHVENELDRYLRYYRETQLVNVADDAAQLRDTATNVDKALTKLERFLSTLSNLAVEVRKVKLTVPKAGMGSRTACTRPRPRSRPVT